LNESAPAPQLRRQFTDESIRNSVELGKIVVELPDKGGRHLNQANTFTGAPSKPRLAGTRSSGNCSSFRAFFARSERYRYGLEATHNPKAVGSI
jgi:hypothetical protein